MYLSLLRPRYCPLYTEQKRGLCKNQNEGGQRLRGKYSAGKLLGRTLTIRQTNGGNTATTVLISATNCAERDGKTGLGRTCHPRVAADKKKRNRQKTRFRGDAVRGNIASKKMPWTRILMYRHCGGNWRMDGWWSQYVYLEVSSWSTETNRNAKNI